MFSKAGFLGQLEAMKDERLSKVFPLFQARGPGKLMQIKFQRILAERYGTPFLHPFARLTVRLSQCHLTSLPHQGKELPPLLRLRINLKKLKSWNTRAKWVFIALPNQV